MIRYRIGDATEPCIAEGIRLIAHVCNDEGKWGAGFSGALSSKWPEAKKNYKAKAKFSQSFGLGEMYCVFVEVDLGIVNMIAQHGISRDLLNYVPIRYDSLEMCLEKLSEGVRSMEFLNPKKKVTVHMPRIGCGLAGGSWDIVGPLIEENLWDAECYVYDLEKK
jgi:O-acetyl-ADP-ribose deacetylase (regulator of RNase III)